MTSKTGKRRRPEVDIPDREPPESATAERGLERPKCDVTLQLPLGPELPEGTVVPRHVETRLDRDQGDALRRLFEGLHQRGVRLASGQHVDRYAQVIRYLLDQVVGQVNA